MKKSKKQLKYHQNLKNNCKQTIEMSKTIENGKKIEKIIQNVKKVTEIVQKI